VEGMVVVVVATKTAVRATTLTTSLYLLEAAVAVSVIARVKTAEEATEAAATGVATTVAAAAVTEVVKTEGASDRTREAVGTAATTTATAGLGTSMLDDFRTLGKTPPRNHC